MMGSCVDSFSQQQHILLPTAIINRIITASTITTISGTHNVKPFPGTGYIVVVLKKNFDSEVPGTPS